MVDGSGMETLLCAEGMEGKVEREEDSSGLREGYSACGKTSRRLTLGQRIEPVSAGKRIAPLSTPQLSQSRNCSFSPLTTTGLHPIPSARTMALCDFSSPANQSAHSGT